MNEQPIEKIQWRDDGALSVFSVFKTIQGEGPLSGTPAIFVRLAGCVLNCPACDTDYTSTRTLASVDVLVEMVTRCKAIDHTSMSLVDHISLVVLTGGEPLRQNVSPFVNRLLSEGFIVQVETNGCVCPEGLPWGDSRFTLVCSPKNQVIADLIGARRHCLLDRTDVYWKYVIRHGEVDPGDGLPTRTMLGQRPARPQSLSRDRWSTNVFVQPLDEKDHRLNVLNVKAAVESCVRFGYRLSLQLHKYIGLE